VHDVTFADRFADQVAAIRDELAAADGLTALRAVRRRWSARLADRDGCDVLDLARALAPAIGARFVAYELVRHHPGALALVDRPAAEELAGRLSSWGEVDAFAALLSGPAWSAGALRDADVHAWAASPDRWWRRTALVATTGLNTRSRGGRGDTARTLAVCALLVDDRDDMVVKAMSWALRELIWHDPAAVRRFVAGHDVAPRVRREVTNKLGTGHKNPTRRHNM
jgi:3-methyladenine DNA glycosylase AlkD